MARIVLSINVTLDGCCDHTQVIADDEHHQYVTALLSGAIPQAPTFQRP
jgi:hypothetical protein